MEAYYDDKYVWKITHNMTACFIFYFFERREPHYMLCSVNSLKERVCLYLQSLTSILNIH